MLFAKLPLDSDLRVNGETMAPHNSLNLCHTEWPLCLLEFNRNLDKTQRGNSLEVWVQDPDILHAIKSIVTNAGCRIIRIDEQTGRFKICIRKS